MENQQQRHHNHSNTLILTDPTLLHPQNAAPLAETLNALKEFVKSKTENCLQILHLISFQRIILIFQNSQIADLVYNYFHQLGIKIGFARHDNKLVNCDLHSSCDNSPNSLNNNKQTNSSDSKLKILKPTLDISQESSPLTSIDEKYPGESVFNVQNNTYSSNNKLEPPNPPIQMQSPPPSPYEGWIERPEDPPSSTTIGFHPKNLGHILYTYNNNDQNNTTGEVGINDLKMKRVFSSVIESNLPDKPIDDLDDLDIGEGLHDDDGMYNGKLNGSLFQKSESNEKIKKNISKLKIPIVIVDTVEAENLRNHAARLDGIEKK